jgi:hypothetical protein
MPTTLTPIRALGDMKERFAGLGALTFVGVVIVQNLIRGSSAPTNDAPGDEVLRFYADHRSTTFLLVATFVVSGIGLAMFLGGVARRLIASDRPAWAFTGLIGATGILVLFTTMLACEQALSVIAAGDSPDSSAIAALWALHNSVFTLLWLFIAIALFGLARAGVAAGLTPAVFERLATVGAVLLTLGCVAGPAIAAGDAMPLFGLSLVGFVTWLAFLVASGLRLVRSEAVTGHRVGAG